jgi:excisionase family DNA binding protein
MAPPLPPYSDRRLESIPTVADRLSITEKEVRRMIYRGELFSVKLGRRRLVPAEETDRLIDFLIRKAAAG